jgi:putrescine aminotransferase
VNEPSLHDRTYADVRDFINPPLARVMKLSGAPVAVRAHGVTIWDDQGKAYLDFAGGYGVFTLGHTHPRVVAAVKAQLDVMALSSKVMFEPLAGRLAHALAAITPGDLQYSFFCNSGTEAVEGALKLARAATKRMVIVATHDAYHGKTLGALTVSGSAHYQAPFEPLLPDVRHVAFGDVDALRGAIAGAAALIVEPIQGEGGVNVPPRGYLAQARAICSEAGALLIADEVQTGLGRCGAMFACDLENVVPDIITLAKGLSGGVMPIGAYIARPDVWKAAYAQEPLLHTSTFGGNPLACAAALEALDVLHDENLIENARLRGEELIDGAHAIAQDYPEIVAAVRGRGLLVGVELCSEGFAGTIIPEMLKAGVTAAWTLNRQRVIRLEPPLIVTSEHVATALAALRGGVERARQRFAAHTPPAVTA